MQSPVRALLAVLYLFSTWPAQATAEAFDAELHAKALAYDAWAREWHTTGLGGSTELHFTDASLTEIQRTAGAGDSTDWTTFYMVGQCLRYRITGDQVALQEVERIARYLHLVHTVTQSPGYIARYVGIDTAPWNVESLNSDSRVQGTGDFEGLFWLGQQSRDKFMHWFWGLAWAHDTLEDETLKQTLRDDMVRVATALHNQNWTIIDPWGDTWPAANIGGDVRVEILLATAHVTQDPAWQAAADAEFETVINVLPITAWHGLNRYFDYYAFINDVPISNTLFRLLPDRARVLQYQQSWKRSTRRFTEGTHSTLFDVIDYGVTCVRLGLCTPAEIDAGRADVLHGLRVFPEAPNVQRAVNTPDVPLDGFSVWASDWLDEHPAIGDLLNIDPQTAEPHEVENRCWTSHLWERSPYHVGCNVGDDPKHVAPGYDFTLAYWFGVYYGLLPGNGPYE